MAVFVGSYCLRYHWNMKYDPGSSFWVSDPWVPWRLLRCRNTAQHLKKKNVYKRYNNAQTQTKVLLTLRIRVLIGRHIVEVEEAAFFQTGLLLVWKQPFGLSRQPVNETHFGCRYKQSHFVEYIWRLEDQWVCLQSLSTMTVSVTNTHITADATPICPSISYFILPSLTQRWSCRPVMYPAMYRDLSSNFRIHFREKM